MTNTIMLGARQRVRTPGKYVVMFAAAALLVIFGATSLLRDIDHAQPLTLAGASTGAPGSTDIVPLREFLVDLAPDRSGRVTFLKLSVQIVAPPKSGARFVERVAAAEPLIAERVTFMLRGLSPEDFAGEEGMRRVKAEIRRRINLVLAPDEAADVVISDLVIQ
ncbi:MAG: flagellar basal body-associated protein FliL [Amphiplicatus sp.]